MKNNITLTAICLFLIGAAQAATLSSNKSSYKVGESITVTFGTATKTTDWVGMYKSTTTPGSQNSLKWQYLNGTTTAPKSVVTKGTLKFTAPATKGSYKFCFHPNNAYTVGVTLNFTVVDTVAVVASPPAAVIPVANFSSSATSISAGSTVTFTDISTNAPTSRSWAFTGGSPATSTLASQAVRYDSAGTYAVSLTATNAAGSNTITKAAYITVTAPAPAVIPVADFVSSATAINTGSSVTFSDVSTNMPTSRAWVFTGGSPATSTLASPVVRYDSAGTYTVSLTAANAAGSNTMTKTAYITVTKAAVGVPTDLKMLHLNVWQEGTSVANGMTYIRDVIATVNPDIVSFSEVRNYSGDWTTKIVNDLAAIGLTYYRGYVTGADCSIISKYPITSTGPLLQNAVSLFNINVNGNTIVVATAHLDYTYYACYLPRGYNCGGSSPYTGWGQIGSPNPTPVTNVSTISAQNLGSQRDEQIAAFINYVKTETRPVILAGDFNEPSHLDWTSRQATLYDHNGVVFPWHTTTSLQNNGFTDAYRQVYPDEVANPGLTWPSFATGAGSTSWTPKSDERDRIDFIFHKGAGVSATKAAVVGSKQYYVKNVLSTAGTGSDTNMAASNSWPSDHKGVFSIIRIPAAAVSAKVSGIEEAQALANNLEIKVYPNPSFGYLNIVSNEDALATVSVLNIAGQEVYNKNMDLVSTNLNTIDIAALPAGMYFLKVATGEKVQTVKFIHE